MRMQPKLFVTRKERNALYEAIKVVQEIHEELSALSNPSTEVKDVISSCIGVERNVYNVLTNNAVIEYDN